MNSAPERPALKARYLRRRAALVQRAAEEFAKTGFDATSVDDLCLATGLTSGGIYHYIGSKDDLLFEILNQTTEPLLVGAREIEVSDDSAIIRLRRLLRLWVNHIAEHRFHMLVFSQERHVIERDPVRWEQVRSSRREFERILADLLGPAMEQTGVTVKDPRLTVLALLGMVNHAPQWMSEDGRLNPDEIADGFLDVLLAGVALPSNWLDSMSD